MTGGLLVVVLLVLGVLAAVFPDSVAEDVDEESPLPKKTLCNFS